MTPFNFNQIETLNGSNFKRWKQDIELCLGFFDYEHVLHEDPPAEPTPQASKEEKNKVQTWHKHNRMALVIMKRSMSEAVKGGIPDAVFARDFYNNIQEKYKVSDKAETGNLMSSLTTMKFDGIGSIREYIMKGIECAAKLKNLGVNIDDAFLVHLVLNSLPQQYSQLQCNYNTQKEKWSLNELISICVQEEERVKKGKSVVVNLVNKPQFKKKFKPKFSVAKTFTSGASTSKGSNSFKNNKLNFVKCFFCHKPGHVKKDCQGFKDWLAKKGNKTIFHLETNVVSVSSSSWWFDTASPIHVITSMQGFLRKRIPNKDEARISSGNGNRVAVKAIGVVRLIFPSGFVLDLEDVLCIPSMQRNLVSGSLFVKTHGFSFTGNNKSIDFFKFSEFIGNASLIDGYWHMNCSNSIEVFLTEKNIGFKRPRFRENSSFLWHKRLGHISKERLKILVKQNILPVLDFSDFDVCIECLKGKTTNHRKKGSVRSQELLELIHTDICRPFPHKIICGNMYFITFIDDFSRYCHIFLISEKSKALEVFKIFKTEAEKQLNKVIKVVRSDRGGEFYGRYTESGQNKGPFALYLQECGIKAQYTTPGTPQQNGVAERRNRTLINMVRSMISRFGLPKFLWGEALKTANYICNRTPSKSVDNGTPFELWFGRKPSLFHFHVWGCKAEARIYNPQAQKLDSRTSSAYFIGYLNKSKGYRFYTPHSHTRILETNRATFIDEMSVSESANENNLEPEVIESSRTDSYEWLLYSDNEEVDYGLPENNEIQVDNNILLPPVNFAQENDVQNEPLIMQHENNNGVLVNDVIMQQQEQQQQGHDLELQNNEAAVPPQQQEVQNPDIQLRRSQRARRSAIPDYYETVFLRETDYDLGEEDDPTNYTQAIETVQSEKWIEAMKSELQSMDINGVWELVDKPEGYKAIGCKWVFKTKKDSKGNIERYKARLVAKGFTQKEGIDYKETFSPVSTKDAFRGFCS